MFGVIRIGLSFLPVVRCRMSQTVPCRSLRPYALRSSESGRILCRIRWEDSLGGSSHRPRHCSFHLVSTQVVYDVYVDYVESKLLNNVFRGWSLRRVLKLIEGRRSGLLSLTVLTLS